MNKVLIVTGQFLPYTKSLGGILRVLSFVKDIKKKNKVYLIASKCTSNQKYGYLGIPKNDLKNVKINYIKNNNQKYFHSIINFKLFRNLFYLFGFDYALNLNQRYYKICCKIIKEEKINFLVISSPPFSLFYIVKRIKKKFNNIKIILDYRDGWSTRINNIMYFPIKTLVKSLIEKNIVSFADFVITATSDINEKINKFTKKNPILIRNGFLFKPKINLKRKKINKIKIGYFGLISEDKYSYRNIGVIYDIMKKNKHLQNKFVFEFYGNNEIKKDEINNFGAFRFKKNLNFAKALHKMTEMDYLLILHTEASTAKEMMTSKFYDYLASTTPIINISAAKNEVGRIIKKHAIGYNINYKTNDLEFFFKNLKKRKKIKWEKNFSLYSRDYQNKKLLEIINYE